MAALRAFFSAGRQFTSTSASASIAWTGINPQPGRPDPWQLVKISGTPRITIRAPACDVTSQPSAYKQPLFETVPPHLPALNESHIRSSINYNGDWIPVSEYWIAAEMPLPVVVAGTKRRRPVDDDHDDAVVEYANVAGDDDVTAAVVVARTTHTATATPSADRVDGHVVRRRRVGESPMSGDVGQREGLASRIGVIFGAIARVVSSISDKLFLVLLPPTPYVKQARSG